MESQQKTDLQLANEELVKLKRNITAKDRKEAPASESVVVFYLKGQGSNLDTATELLQFFRKRIEERREIIMQSK